MKRPARCRIACHRWEPWHVLWVWKTDLQRAVRVRSRMCYGCGKNQDHVVRAKPVPELSA